MTLTTLGLVLVLGTLSASALYLGYLFSKVVVVRLKLHLQTRDINDDLKGAAHAR